MIDACKVISADGLDRLNGLIAAAVTDGFSPHGSIIPISNGDVSIVMVDTGTPVDACKVIKAVGLVRFNQALTDAVTDGFYPVGRAEVGPNNTFFMVLAKGGDTGGGTSDITSADITDASTVGKNLLTAADAAAARTALGASTVGANVLTAADAAAARAAIGAGIGNSNLVIGTTATQAKAGNWKPAAIDVTDSGAFGRQLLQAADQAAAKTLLGIS